MHNITEEEIQNLIQKRNDGLDVAISEIKQEFAEHEQVSFVFIDESVEQVNSEEELKNLISKLRDKYNQDRNFEND